MRRIGLAASKMAQGHLLAYNLFVVLISCLFSILIFFVCGFAVLVALFLIALLIHILHPGGFQISSWIALAKICLAALAVMMGLLNIIAIVKNLKLTREHL